MNQPAVAPDQSQLRNAVLRRLPEEEWALVAPHLERVELPIRALLYDPCEEIEWVHFLEQGIASILSVVGDGSAVETATIGFEGMIGMAVFHEMVATSEQAMMQSPGVAYRLRADRLREVLPSSPALRRTLHRVAAYCFTFAAQNSGCNRKHGVEQRLARWLTIVDERIEGDTLGLTHDFISQMLGVRRATVTEALGEFEERGLIRARRGTVQVTDHAGLEATSCECHRVIRAAFDALLDDRDRPRRALDVKVSEGGESIVGDGTPTVEDTDTLGSPTTGG